MDSIRIKRGLSKDLPTNLPLGELAFCTDTQELWVGTGSSTPLKKVKDSELEKNLEQTNAQKVQYLTPLMFGAKGDGISDDTEALRMAVYTSHTTGKLLYFPNDCKCLVSEPLNYYNNAYYDVTLNMRGVLPSARWEYALSNYGGIVIKKPTNLFYGKRISGEISNLSFTGIRDENLHFFDSCNLNGIYIHGCNITNFGAFLYDSGMGGVSRIDSNTFLTVFYFHRHENKATSIVDSYITNNYINGGAEPTDNACFEFQDGNGSTIQGNFIDFYKSIYRPKPQATVQLPTSVGNQYQVFLYLVDMQHGGTFYFSSVNDTFNWNDENTLQKLTTYKKNTYVGRDGKTYEVPPYIALARYSSCFKMTNAYIQSNVKNVIFVEGQNTEYALGTFDVDFVGVNRYNKNAISFRKGSTEPYYNAGGYMNNCYNTWFVEDLEELPPAKIGWCKYYNGHMVRVNNQCYRYTNKYNQELSKWEAKWVEIDYL